mmetsp:Transcript_37317/g.60438  ORF Transcript_37317/g.60438 Transcript_37317/m.60438 type:complete len:282 (-) Transcript_37317:22-867(-)
MESGLPPSVETASEVVSSVPTSSSSPMVERLSTTSPTCGSVVSCSVTVLSSTTERLSSRMPRTTSLLVFSSTPTLEDGSGAPRFPPITSVEASTRTPMETLTPSSSPAPSPAPGWAASTLTARSTGLTRTTSPSLSPPPSRSPSPLTAATARTSSTSRPRTSLPPPTGRSVSRRSSVLRPVSALPTPRRWASNPASTNHHHHHSFNSSFAPIFIFSSSRLQVENLNCPLSPDLFLFIACFSFFPLYCCNYLNCALPHPPSQNDTRQPFLSAPLMIIDGVQH